MDSLTSGTFVGAGSFRCSRCGYVQTLVGSDTLGDCPGCAGRSFVRASLFSESDISSVQGELTSLQQASVLPLRPRRRG